MQASENLHKDRPEHLQQCICVGGRELLISHRPQPLRQAGGLCQELCVRRRKACHTGDCAGPAGPARDMPGYALTSAGFQMLILRVSGITKIAMMKHTAGTKIG